MVKQSIDFVKDQRDIGSDIMYFIKDPTSPLRSPKVIQTFLYVVVLLFMGFVVWQNISLHKQLAEQAAFIEQLRAANVHEQKVADATAKLREGTVEIVSELDKKNRESSDKLSVFSQQHEKDRIEAVKSNDSKKIALADIDFIRRINTVANPGTTIPEPVISFNFDEQPKGEISFDNKVVKVGEKTISKPSSKKDVKKSKPKVAKIKPRKKNSKVVDPLIGKVFANSVEYRKYWENEFWKTVGEAA